MAALRKDSRRTSDAIVAAAAEITVQEGAGSLTPAKVALRAGVSRATVHRHWPDGADLVQAVLDQVEFPPLADEVFPLDDRIRLELERLAKELASPKTRRLLSILLERAERLDNAESLRNNLIATFVSRLDEALAQAARDGELRVIPDPAELFDRLVGPLWSRRMLRGQPITKVEIEQVIHDALLPWRAPSK